MTNVAKLTRISLLSVLGAALAVGSALLPESSSLATTAVAQEEEQKEERKTKRTAAMRESVYKKLAEAQAAMEADDEAGAMKALNDVQKIKELTPYETAQYQTFMAFMYFQQERYPDAIRAYEEVLRQPELPEGMANQTRYSLAQLYFTQEDYRSAVDMMEIWFQSTTNPGPQPYLLIGQGYYQLEDYERALTAVNEAIRIQQDKGTPVREQTWLLLRVLYYELDDYNNVARILKILINEFPKRDYYVQLSGVYGELEKPTEQLGYMQLAYDQGMLDRGQEILNLSQLLMQAEVPYRAAVILDKGFNDGLVERSVRNLRILAQAWQMAAEDQRALGPLGEAAKLSDEGELNIRLAQSYFNLSMYKEAVDAAREGLRKGKVKRVDNANVLLGTALFEIDRLNEARSAFQEAQKDDRTAKAAAQWINYINGEQDRRKQLADAMSDLQPSSGSGSSE